jgi:hypothetical protein
LSSRAEPRAFYLRRAAPREAEFEGSAFRFDLRIKRSLEQDWIANAEEPVAP